MKQVDFYLISNRLREAKFKFASRFSNKLKRLDKTPLIITDDADASQTMSACLWAHRDIGFLR